MALWRSFWQSRKSTLLRRNVCSSYGDIYCGVHGSVGVHQLAWLRRTLCIGETVTPLQAYAAWLCSTRLMQHDQYCHCDRGQWGITFLGDGTIDIISFNQRGRTVIAGGEIAGSSQIFNAIGIWFETFKNMCLWNIFKNEKFSICERNFEKLLGHTLNKYFSS